MQPGGSLYSEEIAEYPGFELPVIGLQEAGAKGGGCQVKIRLLHGGCRNDAVDGEQLAICFICLFGDMELPVVRVIGEAYAVGRDRLPFRVDLAGSADVDQDGRLVFKIVGSEYGICYCHV